MTDLILDDLELELRKLPGVRSAGFDARDELLIIQLHVVPGTAPETSLPLAATRIAARHADRPVAVEVVRWRDAPLVEPADGAPAATATATTTATATAPAPGDEAEPAEAMLVTAEPGAEAEASRRMRLLAVLSFPDTDELEVHLILDGRRAIGRAPGSRGLVGALDATLAAVHEFGFPLPTPLSARALESHDEEALILVALEESEPAERVLYGVAVGATPIDAAARATLDAINRRISRV
ncbi:MAG: hypothetical protein QOH10_1355 [Actinomycetota bacterium]|nr:hypothetical protein [Actinomycetota bacterium]